MSSTKRPLSPDHVWVEVYTRRVHWRHPEHTKRFDKADRAKRLVEHWMNRVPGEKPKVTWVVNCLKGTPIHDIRVERYLPAPGTDKAGNAREVHGFQVGTVLYVSPVVFVELHRRIGSGDFRLGEAAR